MCCLQVFLLSSCRLPFCLPSMHGVTMAHFVCLPACASLLQVRSIKAAEASSESKYLAGQGFARFFIAIAAGAREAVKVAVTGR